MALVSKLIPQLLSWAGVALVLLRGFPGRRSVVAAGGAAGFAVGVAGACILSRFSAGGLTVVIVKSALGVSLFLLWWISVAAIYRSTGRGGAVFRAERFVTSPLSAALCALLAGILAGGVSACRIPDTVGSALPFVVLALAAVAVACAALGVEKLLPPSLAVSPAGIAAGVVALLLFGASSMIRLDLFSPLSMKVMKGIHDFVHQFMESILIPDHLFVRPVVWKYIGFLFGKEVGFWGGMVIWFTPAALISLSIFWERLPSVAHIRQGAQRRRLLAAAIRGRRYRLVVPLLALVVFGAAAYQSRFPNVEYWDPKPVSVSASPAGEIFIPKKGDVNLEDGKLHKYLFKQGDREARFFVLLTPAGQLTVVLDACAICKPDGYGQTEGTVICYYCKTLIPLETVGKPGGCNPVPVAFTDKPDGVAIDGATLLKTWSSTVQSTARVKEGGK